MSWTAPDSDGGLPITGYQVEVSSDPGHRVWSPLLDNSGSTSMAHGDSSLEPGATRLYRVRARNLLGRSEPSNQVEATTPLEAASCDIYCATMTSVESLIGGFGYATSTAFPGSELSPSGFTLAGTAYTVSGLINVTSAGLVQFRLNDLPPESAVEGLSLYVGDIELLPFGVATRDTTDNLFEWTDTERFSDTIFPVGTVDVRIDKGIERVVSITAKAASVDSGDNAEFIMTRTGSLVNGLLVKVYYAEADSTSCAWFGEGQRTLTIGKRSITAATTFRVDPYVADEYCGSRANGIRYELPYKVGSANSATVTINS